ncbi:unnamed protein product [Vicia faba]|uniref:ABC transporter domain-containing protein n=1 Tax=Vicia faba TaxID=3906 RepID=A0AAV1AP86_VICFA|nr:unnamed protein product [Vicia faba]
MENFTASFNKSQALISEEALAEINAATTGDHISLDYRLKSNVLQLSYKLAYKNSSYSVYDDRYNFNAAKGKASRRSFSSTTVSAKVGSISETDHSRKREMVLPFTPLSITFDEIGYEVDMPQEIKAKGILEDPLELLKGVNGAFRPGVLTALMGISGAGKTTLMDVDSATRKMFIEEVMELIELTSIRERLVGFPGAFLPWQSWKRSFSS